MERAVAPGVIEVVEGVKENPGDFRLHHLDIIDHLDHFGAYGRTERKQCR